MAQNGHNIIATVQFSPHVTPLREKAKAPRPDQPARSRSSICSIPTTSPTRRPSDIDVLWNNAGIGESGPVVRDPARSRPPQLRDQCLHAARADPGLRQEMDRSAKKKAKIVFTSSMGGLFTPANWGVYVSTKHALESVAEAMQQELAPLRHQGPDHQSRRLLHRLQRDDGRHGVPLARRRQACHQARRAAQGVRCVSSMRPTAISMPRR